MDYAGLEQFAEALVQGSRNALMAASWSTYDAFRTAYGKQEQPDTNQTRAIEELFPDSDSTSDRYKLSPYGVEVVVNEDGDTRRLGLSEFICGIAVANGVEPTNQEVEATIFHIASELGKLSR